MASIAVKTLYMNVDPTILEIVHDRLNAGGWWFLLPVTDEAKVRLDDLAKKYKAPNEDLQSIKIMDDSMIFPGHYLLMISKSVFPLDDVLMYFEEYGEMDLELLGSAHLLIGGVGDIEQVCEQFKLWLYRA